MRHKSGKWKIHVGLAILTPNQASQRKVWGSRWTSKADRNFMRLGCRKYRTLDEALHELETLGEPDSQAALSQLL